MNESCATRAPIAPTDRLYVPHRKRLTKSYAINEEGVRELRIDYGLKEISFDEEHLFPFGEQLVSLPSFTAETATSWGPGYPWAEIHPLLEALLDEGIIKRGDGGDERATGGLAPSPLPPSTCPMARTWSAAECESITRDLGKRPVEVGYLESVVPVFRIAHAALDADDRQVGEANVYPPTLRLDRETEWRVCQYSGSRYQDDSPMNITALKAMIKHWKPMMAALLEVRAALAGRLSIAVTGQPWSIGDLHTLACVVLALPAYQLMKGGGQSPQPPLHPVLSSLFRITDGIRMTMYEMQFLLSEKPRHADDPMTAAEIYSYSETHGVFISPTGVCAGPKPLIDEFLVTAVDGVPAEGIEGLQHSDEVAALLAQLPEIVDYGLYGLQIWGLTHSTWLLMSQAYHGLLEVLERCPQRSEVGERLVAKLRADWIRLERTQIAKDYDREVHQRAYADAYERSHRALCAPIGKPTLAEHLEPCAENAEHEAVERELRAALGATGLDETAAARAAAVLVHYLRQEQAILVAVTSLEEEINSRLQRPRPTRPLAVRDIKLYYTMGGGTYPYLFDALESELGVQVEPSAGAIRITTSLERRAG
jgi:hypothetical protein